ncbi:hypothetical protein PUNSTDRAFT_118323 [Punctularia strigosozonata HHB-11173 SS5]|uniref:uncharacterized protein n=1 Tax=Punctularia strigosozonata (strain HHB-11173) TaxID=741275 RepID=UPI0004417885|nr:uncharacterized protein PUNSTDRAFT_118323 [Punctularia strigosozonata HHB-11173 SS5]EIN12520.1 hypothetical protein PUNSTDRAFT_118323 [Punctularia strigosozonata HHB-11173 SS5]
MPEFSRAVLDVARDISGRWTAPHVASAFSGTKREAPDQGGLLSGKDPSAFNTSDPLRLWIIQVGIIIMMTQLLSLGLRRMKQPRVIAEVLGGIILGPTACGRIPGFTKHVFPDASRPYLSLVANIGLVLFLFLVGLEIESSVIKRNARLSATVALAGMVLPFGLGAALSVPLYHQFIDQSVKFTNFMLFTGVAYSITAFPVLCRILTELKLLDTTVGIVVLSAGVGNDIVGWTLLALSVALVNAGSGLTALYILLVCVGWTLLLLFPIRLLLRWLALRTRSLEGAGPSSFFMTCTMLLVFGSAFFTDIIGVHAIFGAFLAGLIVPRDGNLAIQLTEKLEDMVSIIFLPLYFTLSGLSTNLGLLDNGITWGFTVAICTLAYAGKMGGCTLAARWAGFSWREASTIGSLMSCKGLVELIVLNVGLSAGILSPRVFSMFVLEALLLTFMTTPAVSVLYPPHLRTRAAGAGANFASVAADEAGTSRPRERRNSDDDGSEWRRQYTVVLDKIEHVPGMMALTDLLRLPSADDARSAHTTDEPRLKRDPSSSSSKTSTDLVPAPRGREKRREKKDDATRVDALRLVELSDRTSAVMRELDRAAGSLADALARTDPLLAVFKMYGELRGLAVSAAVAIAPYEELAACVVEHAARTGGQMILLPWLPPHAPAHEAGAAAESNPFDMLFGGGGGGSSGKEQHPQHPHQGAASAHHAHFVRSVFAKAGADVALFVDRGHAPDEARTAAGARRHHVYVPFFGGPDDRLAVEMAVRLCRSWKTRATVVRVTKREVGAEEEGEGLEKPERAYLGEGAEAYVREQGGATLQTTMTGFPDTVYGQHNTQTRMQSETADNVLWSKYAEHVSVESADPSGTGTSLSAALARVEFVDLASPRPLHAVVQQVAALLPVSVDERARLLVLAGRSRRLAVENHAEELKAMVEEHGGVNAEVRKTVGDVATAFVLSGLNAGLVVVQAASASAH